MYEMYEMYEIYEMYEMCKMYEIYKKYEVEGIWGSPAGDLPPGYDSRSTWEPALAV